MLHQAKNNISWGAAGDQEPALTRADYGEEEVTEYFNYMGMLAEEVRTGGLMFLAFKRANWGNLVTLDNHMSIANSWFQLHCREHMIAYTRCLHVSLCCGVRALIILPLMPLSGHALTFLVPPLTPHSFIIAAGVDACDLLLLMSCKEGDTPKVEELLEAGANPTIKDKDGKTPLDLATKEEVIEMLEAALAKA